MISQIALRKKINQNHQSQPKQKELKKPLATTVILEQKEDEIGEEIFPEAFKTFKEISNNEEFSLKSLNKTQRKPMKTRNSIAGLSLYSATLNPSNI